MAKKKEDSKEYDIDKCKRKIKAILAEYNCEIKTDDYHNAWLYDNDTGQTVGING